MINENEEKYLQNAIDSINEKCDAGFGLVKDYSKKGKVVGVGSNINISLSSTDYITLNGFLNGIVQTIRENDNINKCLKNKETVIKPDKYLAEGGKTTSKPEDLIDTGDKEQ